MHSQTLLETELKKALDAGDDQKVDRLRDRVLSLLLRIVAGESTTKVEDVRITLERAFAHVAAKSSFTGVRDSSVNAWLLASDAHLASLAEGLVPSADAPRDLKARERLLQVLASANSRMSNSSLADRCGLAQETVARILPKLRTEGLVKSRRVGRAVINEITDGGRVVLRHRSDSAADGLAMSAYRQPRNAEHHLGINSHIDADVESQSQKPESELTRNIGQEIVNNNLPPKYMEAVR